MSLRNSSPATPSAHSTVPVSPSDGEKYHRCSRARAQKLRRYVSTITGTTNISIILTDEIPTANVRPNEAGDGYVVQITTREIPQPATDYDRDVFDRAVQHGLALHECGHILYTDFLTLFNTMVEAVDSSHPKVQQFAKTTFNTFEDGAIEQNIREDLSENAANRLRTVNANLSQTRINSVSPTEQQNMTAPNAIEMALLDICVAGSGATQKLTDDTDDSWAFINDTHERLFAALFPVIQETHIKCLTAPDAETRANHIAECWNTIEATLFSNSAPEESSEQGDKQAQNSGHSGVEGDDSQNGASNTGQSDGDSGEQSDRQPDEQSDEQSNEITDSSSSEPGSDPDEQSHDGGAAADADANQSAEGADAGESGEGGSDSSGSNAPDESVSDLEIEPDHAAPDEEFTSPHGNDIEDGELAESLSEIDADTRDDISQSSQHSPDELASSLESLTGTRPPTPTDDSQDGAGPDDEAGDAGEDAPAPSSSEENSSDTGENTTDSTQPAAQSDSTEEGNKEDTETTEAGNNDASQDTSDPATGDSSDTDHPPGDDEQASLFDFQSGVDAQQESHETESDERTATDGSNESPTRDSANSAGSEEQNSTSDSEEPPETTQAGGDSDDASPPAPPTLDSPIDGSDDLAEQEAKGLQSEQKAANRKEQQETRAREQAQAATDTLDYDVEILPNSDGRFDPDRYTDATNGIDGLVTSLKARLTNNDLGGTHRGTASGTPAGSLLYNTATGNPNIMAQEAPSDEKEYRFVIIIDRSGSMKREITEAEAALVKAILALEKCGVEVAVIDFYEDDVRIIKPFNHPTRQSRQQLMTAECGGRTPLGKALEVAKSQLNSSRKPGHVIAVTDDDPTDEDRYEQARRTSQYPVHGIKINFRQNTSPHGRTSTDLYDTSICVSEKGELQRKLIELANKLSLN